MNSLAIFVIGFSLFCLWVIYAGWSAPLMEEQSDGSWKTIKPEKKLSDLFKKKKNNSGSYSDLEKLGRGRSKH
jgi:hypothetical protein